MNESEKRRKNFWKRPGACTATGGPRLPYTPDTGGLPQTVPWGRDRRGNAGTFGLRAFCCFLLFAAFVAMDYQGGTILEADSQKITEEIATDLDVAEVWKNL